MNRKLSLIVYALCFKLIPPLFSTVKKVIIVTKVTPVFMLIGEDCFISVDVPYIMRFDIRLHPRDCIYRELSLPVYDMMHQANATFVLTCQQAFHIEVTPFSMPK